MSGAPLVRQQCAKCGCETFAVYYDPKAMACHVECTDCGSVILL